MKVYDGPIENASECEFYVFSENCLWSLAHEIQERIRLIEDGLLVHKSRYVFVIIIGVILSGTGFLVACDFCLPVLRNTLL